MATFALNWAMISRTYMNAMVAMNDGNLGVAFDELDSACSLLEEHGISPRDVPEIAFLAGLLKSGVGMAEKMGELLSRKL